MANTTFSGPVISKNGFTSTGPGMTVSLTADTTLTVAAHAGRILLCNDADGKFTLPSINVNSNGATAGDNDFNNLNNIGASFHFFVETAATDMDILTDGTDKFKGSILVSFNLLETPRWRFLASRFARTRHQTTLSLSTPHKLLGDPVLPSSIQLHI